MTSLLAVLVAVSEDVLVSSVDSRPIRGFRARTFSDLDDSTTYFVVVAPEFDGEIDYTRACADRLETYPRFGPPSEPSFEGDNWNTYGRCNIKVVAYIDVAASGIEAAAMSNPARKMLAPTIEQVDDL